MVHRFLIIIWNGRNEQIFKRKFLVAESEPVKEIKRRATKYIKEYTPQELTAETQGTYAGVYKCDKFTYLPIECILSKDLIKNKWE